MGRAPEQSGWTLRSSADAVALFAAELGGLVTEELRVAHLDGEGRLLRLFVRRGEERGTIDLPIPDIVREAIAVGARSLVVAHNHPSGDPTPSRADKAATRRLADVAHGLGIRVLDHLVFGDERCRSFRQMGLL